MASLKPDLIANETVLGEYGCTVYMVRDGISSKGSNVRMWLTNMRILLKAGFGPQRALPVHDIVDIREEKVGWYTMARIAFSGGRLEWFTVQNQPQFLAALQAARTGAPVPPAAAVSPLPAPGQAAGKSSKGIIIAVAVVAAAVLGCICIAAAAIGGYWYFLSS